MAGTNCITSLLCPSRLFILLLLFESLFIALETALGPGWGSWPSLGNLKGCRPDGEGSWSIGIYKGAGPFSLVPLEDVSYASKSRSLPASYNFFLFCFLSRQGDFFPVPVGATAPPDKH